MSGVGFYLFSIILKPPIITLKKTNNNKGYILSNVSKVNNEKKIKRRVFHDFPKASCFGSEFISHSRKTNFNDWVCKENSFGLMKCQHFVRNRAVEFIHFAESQNQTNRNFFTFDIRTIVYNK